MEIMKDLRAFFGCSNLCKQGNSKVLGRCKHFGVRNSWLLGEPERWLGWSEPEGL